MQSHRLDIAPVEVAALLRLQEELGCSFAMAQILARRGLADPAAARDWLEAAERHDAADFDGIDDAVALLRRHVDNRSQITIHGDYDADGVCATAVMVRALRELGATVDWFLPSRTEDGYGLSADTVRRLADRGTQLLVTVDCAITAVEEVALARELGIDVIVTDHHAPRADGRLPDAPLVHPVIGSYPCPDLCGTAVAHKLVAALAGREQADLDLDLVALATVADCVPLSGENRRIVREGLAAMANTQNIGLRALMRVADVDPSRIDARTIGFRLGPRINAAGRMRRADAGLELLLTQDEDRARAIAQELDTVNGDRRHVEQRILFDAEAQVAALGERSAYVLSSDDWHPGVIGIVASRIADRHHRPAILIALDGDQGTGSGRSIPAFDLLGGLNATASHLLRHGGHRAAAGCTVSREAIDEFREAFEAHAASVLTPDDLVRTERVDAVVGGDELGIELAEELDRLAPYGIGNPAVSLLVPAARFADQRTMGEGRHLRFTVESGGARARAVAFGRSKLDPEELSDATFALELNEWRGAVEPRLVLRQAAPTAPSPIVLVGEPEPGSEEWLAAVAGWSSRPEPTAAASFAEPRDRRGASIAGTLAALVHSGERVLAVTADAQARHRALQGRLGGFDLTSWGALELNPSLAASYAHNVALDPPLHPDQTAALTGQNVHLAWGDDELGFVYDLMVGRLAPRQALAALYRLLREHGLAGVDLPAWRVAEPLAVFVELGLVEAGGAIVPGAARRTLEDSATYRALQSRHEEGLRWLSLARSQAA